MSAHRERGQSCPSCEACFLGEEVALCPACGGGPLRPDEVEVHGAPERRLPTRLDAAAVSSAVQRAAGSVWYASPELRGPALAERARLAWWPVWLVDAHVRARWQGRAGTNYEVQSTHEVFRDGRWSTEPHVDTRIRWEPRMGDADTRVDNAAVQALAKARVWEQRLGDFPIQEATRAADRPPGTLRLPDLSPEAARADADDAFRAAVAARVHEAMGADHSDDIVVHHEADGLHWTWLLVPVWTTWYPDDAGQPRMLWVHGTTGRVWGPLLASATRGYAWAAFWGLSGVALLAGSAVVGLIGILLVPLLLVALVGGLLGFLLLGLALHPLWVPRSHNAAEARRTADPIPTRTG